MDFLVQNHEQSPINIPLVKASDYLGRGKSWDFDCLCPCEFERNIV